MSGLVATFGRELRAFFYSPLAYVILFFMLLYQGLIFTTLVSFIANPLSGGETQSLFQYFLGGTFLTWMLFWTIPTLITMRLLAEERRSGSIESLMTAPVSETEVVLGKYFAALVLYLCLWLPTLLYALYMARHSDLDWGPIFAGYLAITLIGGLFLALGVLCSAMTKNQVVAAVASFILALLLTVLSFLDGVASSQLLKDVLAHINLIGAVDEATRGIVDTRRLIYPLSLITLCLFLASRALAAKKWR